MSAPNGLADPRPCIVREGSDHNLAGGLCRHGHPLLRPLPRCPRCGAEVEPRRFGPGGAVWSFTTVHIQAAAGDEPPCTLGYVDLDEGPRVLLRLSGEPPRVEARVCLSETSGSGNPRGEVLG
jgi:uncharacterized OB-fold protein